VTSLQACCLEKKLPLQQRCVRLQKNVVKRQVDFFCRTKFLTKIWVFAEKTAIQKCGCLQNELPSTDGNYCLQSKRRLKWLVLSAEPMP
jgi:hypothetical protein